MYIEKQNGLMKGVGMNKVLTGMMAALLVAGVCGSGFASDSKNKSSEKKFERIVAEVVSLDPATQTIVVKREENGESRTVTISKKAAAKLHVGDRIRIKLKSGTNESAGVRILGARPVAENVAPVSGAREEARNELKDDVQMDVKSDAQSSGK